MATRLSYGLSCGRLRELGLLGRDDTAPMPARLPLYDDKEPLGVNFFRTRLADNLDLSALSLPRTFFGRSEINSVSFRHSDLRESNLCWNDFIGVDFTGTDLRNCDMRSSIFSHVRFSAANLESADLRHSTFVDCVFDGALMRGVALTHQQGSTIALSEAQRSDISWHDDAGPEPEGG